MAGLYYIEKAKNKYVELTFSDSWLLSGKPASSMHTTGSRQARKTIKTQNNENTKQLNIVMTNIPRDVQNYNLFT